MRVKYTSVLSMFPTPEQRLALKGELMTIAWDALPETPTAVPQSTVCPACGNDTLQPYIDPEIGGYFQCVVPVCRYTITEPSLGAD